MTAADDAYRPEPAAGSRVRSDIVDVYVFRRVPDVPLGVVFLQLLRAFEPLKDAWHPVMGHREAGESASACAVRELGEEIGLRTTGDALIGLWALEQVHPYYVAAIDQIVLSPRFACEVAADFEPALNEEHRAHRWIASADVERMFMWPGQIAACREALQHVVDPRSLARDRLRVDLS